MQDAELYQRILGLESPWSVSGVALDVELGTIEVSAAYGGEAGKCPECGIDCTIHDHTQERRWRHLDTCQLQTIIKARIPRSRCPEHGVRNMNVPWAPPYGRFTLLFEALCIHWLKLSKNQTAVAQRLGISFDEAHHIMVKAVERGLERRQESKLRAVGLDEKSMKKGHRYLTVMADLDRGLVYDVAEGRKFESAKVLLTGLTAAQRERVECMCMDMWPPYRQAAEVFLPEAVIVHDRFHVSQHLSDAVDKTRRKEQAALPLELASAVKGSRYLFLYNFNSLEAAQQERFLLAHKAAKLTAAVWESKEVFRSFWEQPSVEEARTFLARWYKQAKAKGIEALTAVAKMLVKHSAGLVAYAKHRITNSIAENINGKIQQLKCIGRGFRTFAHYRTNILFHFAGLELHPLKSQ